MSAFLAAVAVVGGAAFILTRVLPESHPARMRVAAAGQWIKQNPKLFAKRLEMTALGLVVLFFAALTVIYS